MSNRYKNGRKTPSNKKPQHKLQTRNKNKGEQKALDKKKKELYEKLKEQDRRRRESEQRQKELEKNRGVNASDRLADSSEDTRESNYGNLNPFEYDDSTPYKNPLDIDDDQERVERDPFYKEFQDPLEDERKKKELEKEEKRLTKQGKKLKRKARIKTLGKHSARFIRNPKGYLVGTLFTLATLIGTFFLYYVISPIVILLVSFGAFGVVLDSGTDQYASNVEDIGKEQQEDNVVNMDGKVWMVPHTMNLTSPFGHRWGKNHNGIDIAGVGGSPANIDKDIVAFLDGEVVVSMFAKSGSGYGGYGNVVVIQHGDDLRTLYAHLNSRKVKVGDKVKAGDHIGGMGTTGSSTGVHLHFETREKQGNDYVPVNPKKYLEGFKTTGVSM